MKYLCKVFYIVLGLILVVNCDQSYSSTDFVNVFIGTGGHGHTFPGATMPFGMVQLSPDTRLEGWDGCSGYHYSDSIIYGFSHTHLSGTGIADYCDLLIMPSQNDICFDNGSTDSSSSGYSSTFSKSSEKASPGYYEVLLDKNEISCRLTTTKRVGIHEYTFENKENIHLLIDLEHRDKLIDWDIKVRGNNEIFGSRISNSWAEKQHFYFCIRTSHPFDSTIFNNGINNDFKRPTKLALQFEDLLNKKLTVKVGISTVSAENARANLIAEASHWDFDKFKNEAQERWSNALNKIEVEGGSDDEKEIFYTSLYHSMIAPNIISDINGSYRGTDLNVHQSNSNMYTVFSLWDTFRATHPLYSLIEQDKTAEFLNTFLNQYNDGGQLPIWELCANYTGCMIGYHVVSVILDAYVKNIAPDIAKELYPAMLHISNRNKLGIPEFDEKGFISSDDDAESVSKNLEYAYNDWCISQMAKICNDSLRFIQYVKRAQGFKNIFNPSTGFMQPKLNGNFKFGFIPEEVNYNYTEANSWQYSFFVPHDINGLINLHDGKDNFEALLDQLFESDSKLIGRQQSDITGMIGQYAHGNEPSHHMAYLYNYIGKPYKTQQRVAQILKEQYSVKPDGLSGNEDCGQMSSWYVLSALGFYAVTPGLPYYTIGSPLFKKASIHLENGNIFTIKTNKKERDEIYIQSASLNGETFDKSYINHSTIMKGGVLAFEMGNQPNKNWGVDQFPSSRIDSIHSISIVPYFETSENSFADSLLVSIKTVDNDSKIFYRVFPHKEFKVYDDEFYIYNSEKIEAFSVTNGVKSNDVLSSYTKKDGNRKIKLFSNYSNQYNAGGDDALIDGLHGPNSYPTGFWQGYQGQNFEAIVDLGLLKEVSKVSIGSIQEIKSWIWFPKGVEFFASKDGDNFTSIGFLKNDFSVNQYGSFVKNFEVVLDKPILTKYLKVKASNFGKCPKWHLGYGGDTWLFFDEIVIE
jgi:predicted alpha-1,2-mannosidase